MTQSQGQVEEQKAAQMEFWVQKQIEQEEQDVLDLKLLQELNQYQNQNCEHSYIFAKLLPSRKPDTFLELWVCIHCSHFRIMTVYWSS